MKKRKTTEQFIKEANIVHNGKYDYSKVKYEKAIEKVCIICNEHGEFWQTPSMHLYGNGCPECGKIKCHNTQRKTKEQFIKESKEKWGEKYDYSKIEYVNSHTKVCIICPKHGEFWQEPDNHLRWGCKKCRESKMEYEIRELLKNNNIIFEEQKQFPWLKYKGFLKLDFYIPKYNIAIECQGEQHFANYRFEKTDERLKLRQERDKIKKDLCNKNGINIIYYTNVNYEKYNSNDFIIKNKEELIKKILNYD